MAVRIENNQRRYVGLSSDLKPTDGVAPGSTFFETDSTRLFMFDGSDWKSKEQSGATDSLLLEILGELRTQNELIQLVVEKL